MIMIDIRSIRRSDPSPSIAFELVKSRSRVENRTESTQQCRKGIHLKHYSRCQARKSRFGDSISRRPHRIPHIAHKVVAARAPSPPHVRLAAQRMPAAKIAHVAGFQERKEIAHVAVLARELEPTEPDTR